MVEKLNWKAPASPVSESRARAAHSAAEWLTTWAVSGMDGPVMGPEELFIAMPGYAKVSTCLPAPTGPATQFIYAE